MTGVRDRWLRSAGAWASLLGVHACACSAPATESSLRGEMNAVSVRSASYDVKTDEVKARRGETPKEGRRDELRGRCPRTMVDIEGRFCIDKYEASLVEVLPSGEERARSPFGAVDGAADVRVRAVSEPNVFPQGYISAVQASRACAASGKRLCKVSEWTKACRGPDPKAYGYGARREPGRCNDRGKNPVLSLFGRGRWNWNTMNQPQLNQLEGTLARTGAHEGCTNGYGVFDMVGNLHEWVADPRGTFYGGYYQDVASVGHGEGCGYLTTAHEARYHDYSTGFRCCADVAGAAPPPPPAKTRRTRR
ncbi:MAG: SUMF1/EgtB/PvdO family nonheme iron enzyme [Labilithrix sp.]|nr:SUMF1/EgtB/PvdO family nonheme iron enzyme [Labilithrix sp.]